MTNRIEGISAIAGRYDAILCDVWGVIHNGVQAWSDAHEALGHFRRQGGIVALITNAPRPNGPVRDQLRTLGVPDTAYDVLVTSGDVTRTLIRDCEGPIFHIGPDRDRILFEGLDVCFGEETDASVLVCTGLLDDERETPADYEAQLRGFVSRNVPMICANPDIVVERGDRLVWCAGALARDFQALGGTVHISGKPHRPIYEYAEERLAEVRGQPVDKSRLLAIGDGMPTDVAGAKARGLDLLYISAGIHAAEYGEPDNPSDAAIRDFFEVHDVEPVAYMPRLIW